jgi:hypothetical protein
MHQFISQLFHDPEMLRMGHAQTREDNNLGLGWLYYGFTRVVKPSNTVVIGSYRGFSPIVFARAMLDNEVNDQEASSQLHFIDPSMADDFWSDPVRVNDYFTGMDITNIHHYPYTTQDFVNTDPYREINNVGVLMVDGYHSAEQARIDYLAFLDKLTDDCVVFFHDSIGRKRSKFYGEDKAYDYSVCDFMERLKATPGLEVLTVPFGSGVSIVRGKPQTMEFINRPFT